MTHRLDPCFMEPKVYTTGVSSLKKKKIKNTKSGRRPWKDPEVSLPLASWWTCHWGSHHGFKQVRSSHLCFTWHSVTVNSSNKNTCVKKFDSHCAVSALLRMSHSSRNSHLPAFHCQHFWEIKLSESRAYVCIGYACWDSGKHSNLWLTRWNLSNSWSGAP